MAACSRSRAAFHLSLIAAWLLLSPDPGRAEDDGFNPALAPPASLNEKVVMLPGGPERPVDLQVTVFTPPGAGPFPLAVLNHGATNASANHRGERYRYTYSAYYFLSRGYAVAMPMARGFAGSGGRIVTDGCRLEAIGQANAADLRAVIQAIARQPNIDPTRIVVGGQSFGGWTTLAFGTMPAAGVRGLIGFSPAIRASDCAAQDQAMVEGAAAFGSKAKLPSLWFYGDNDSVMPTAEWHAVFKAYKRAGAPAELLSIGAFMSDSHQMLTMPESIAIWTPRVDAFLAKLGLPSTELFPDYLPIPFPRPTHAAAVDDVAAVPSLSDRGREDYRKFLSRPFPRAVAIGPNVVSTANGGFDPLKRAVTACQKAGLTCQLYAVDGDVVWTGSMSNTRAIARTVAAGETATLDFAYNINRDCSSRGLPSLKVSQNPSHGSVAILPREQHPVFAAGNPYAACNDTNVSGTALTYTPAPGFSGDDSVGFEASDADGNHRAYQVKLTVK